MIGNFALLLAAAGLLLVGLPSAKADMAHAYVRLTCDAPANRAMVRFGWAWNDDLPEFPRLPLEVDAGLSSLPVQEAKTCRLANGWEVKVKHGSDRALPYGECGARPPHWFSLWANGRKLFSRRVFYGSCRAELLLHSVIFEDDRIAVCQFDERPLVPEMRPPTLNDPLPVTCDDVDVALLFSPADEREYPPPGSTSPAAGTMTIPFAVDPALCRRLVRVGRKRGDPWVATRQYPEAADNLGTEHDETISFAGIADAQLQFNARMWRNEDKSIRVSLGSAEFDFNNDGTPDVVYRVADDRHAFDGSFYLLPPTSTGQPPGINVVLSDAADSSDIIEKAVARGWRVFHGGQTAYGEPMSTHLDIIVIDGTTYLLAYPARRSREPTALLFKPTAGNGMWLMCEYQRVDDNF